MPIHLLAARLVAAMNAAELVDYARHDRLREQLALIEACAHHSRPRTVADIALLAALALADLADAASWVSPGCEASIPLERATEALAGVVEVLACALPPILQEYYVAPGLGREAA